MKTYDVIVIGGGASGMMAAGRAAERGKQVLLIEKNAHLGEKLKITGGGRCNITNAEPDTRLLLTNYGDSAPFLYSAFSKFGMKDTFSFFESRGLPLVVQARKRAFPSTEKALDVFKVLEAYVRKGKVTIKTNTKISKLLHDKNSITGVQCGSEIFTARSYIVATGGMSHPETGSTGDGFNWLASLGHTVAKPTPTIVPLAVKEQWVKDLAGISLSFMKITFFSDEKKAFSKKGKILFTHFGLSGPLILNSAKKVHELLLNTDAVTAQIDCYPDTDLGSLDKTVIKVFDANKNKMFKNVISEFVPAGLSTAVLSLSGIDGETKVHSVSKEERKALVRLIKALPLTITGLMGFDRAVVADGGVHLTEIDTRNMQSKKYANLFVIGDLLHITRPSGGFSLQLCWTSGYLAGDIV